jgi:opacity protein-like surface antigen
MRKFFIEHGLRGLYGCSRNKSVLICAISVIRVPSLLIFMLLSQAIYSQPKFSEIAVKPGAFSRMGFGARGIGMGNAMSAVTEGNLVSYYNPALSVFQKGNSFQTSYSFLSLDRSLNFLNFTRKFDFYSSKDSLLENPEPRSSAGISAGIINSGVGKIDGRDNNGLQTGELSTSENQFFIGLANRFSKKFALGINAKLYYYKLYEKISSTGIGVDIGALYVVNEQFTVSLMLSDLNSKYKWDSAPVYGQDGRTTEDKFPLLKKLGIGYANKEAKIIAGLEFENSNAGTNVIRLGIEYNLYENLFLRVGVDQFDLSNKDRPAKPALGFSYFRNLGDIIIGVDYAFMIEQYSSHDRHIVGVNINF